MLLVFSNYLICGVRFTGHQIRKAHLRCVLRVLHLPAVPDQRVLVRQRLHIGAVAQSPVVLSVAVIVAAHTGHLSGERVRGLDDRQPVVVALDHQAEVGRQAHEATVVRYLEARKRRVRLNGDTVYLQRQLHQSGDGRECRT